MSRPLNPARQSLRTRALLGAASLCALLAVSAADAAPRKHAPWVDPPGPTAAPEAPSATGSLSHRPRSGSGEARPATETAREGAAVGVPADAAVAEKSPSPARVKRTAEKPGRGKAIRSARSRPSSPKQAKASAEPRPRKDRVARNSLPGEDELSYDDVVRNGVEIDPRTIPGVPRGYRVYSLRVITTVPAGAPVIVMRRPWQSGAFVPYRPF
jgi:hypothetical protein